MCMEDIRLGRTTSSIVKFVSVPLGARTRILEAVERRVRIFLSSDGVATINVTPVQLRSDGGAGITLTPQNPTLLLRVEDWGSTMWQAWEANAVGTAGTLFVMDASQEKT